MKKITTTLTLILMTSLSYAGTPPRTSCSNLDGTIKIDMSRGSVSILTTKHPADKYTQLSLDKLNVAEQSLQKMPVEKLGCTSRAVEFKQITLIKKDGSEMPSAYNRLTQNGGLNDYFICATSVASMPVPGRPCR